MSFEFLCGLAQLQQEGRKQPQPKLCLNPAGSGTLQEGKCPALGEVPSFPGELLTTGMLFQGDHIAFCGPGFRSLWLLDVILVFPCEQGVPALQVSCVVSRSAPSMAIPDHQIALE